METITNIIKVDNDYLIKNNGSYLTWEDGTYVIYGFKDGQTEQSIINELKSYGDWFDGDEIVFANKLPKEIKNELINQIKAQKGL